MQINNINFYNNYNKTINTNFQAHPASKAVRNLSERDRNIIKNYITGLSYRLKMTGEELNYFHKIRTRKQLEKESYQYIAKKLNIPEEILPPLVQVTGDDRADYSYAYLDNVIQANSKLQTQKNEIFSSMRHEFQHFMQICNMLRTEGLTDEVQAYLTSASIKDRKEFITNLIKSSNYKMLDPEEFPDAVWLNSLCDALQNQDVSAFDKRFKPMEKSIKQMWQQMKEVSTKHWGMIKQNTAEARNNRVLFEDLKKYKLDGDMIDWAINKVEKDAILAETFTYKEYNKINQGCYVRNEKRIRDALDKDKFFQNLQKIARERQQSKT